MVLSPALMLLPASLAAAAKSRIARVDGASFVWSATGEPVVFSGPNVVVKGPPWLPTVAGDTICADNLGDGCADFGNCTSCTTFNQADVDHIKSNGWNAIRLGTVWAGVVTLRSRVDPRQLAAAASPRLCVRLSNSRLRRRRERPSDSPVRGVAATVRWTLRLAAAASP